MSLIVQIKKRAGDFQLDVSFQAEQEVFAVLGASGSGKSMTLKCIAGIERPDEGFISLNDRVLFDSEKGIDLPPQKRKVGYLFQEYALFPTMNVEKNIAAGRKYKVSKEEQKNFIRQYHLEGLEQHMPHQLSGGQKQRVAMARMMAAEPELILLDEPFSALDSYLKNQMLMEMKEELEQLQLPVIFVSHDRDEVFRLSHRICAMDHGRNEEPEEKRAFFEHPRTKNAAILSGCKNIVAVKKISATEFEIPDWNTVFELPDLQPELCGIGVRAHDWTVESSQGNNFIEVEQALVEEALFEWNIYLKVKGTGAKVLWKIAKKDSSRGEIPKVGDRLYIAGNQILQLS